MLIEENFRKSEISNTVNNSSRDNEILSVIIRCHKEERLSFLDEALFSLAIQDWQNLEVIVVLQNGTEKFKNRVKNLIEKQPFHQNCTFQIEIVEIPPGVDGRSTLLTHGIKIAKGRYLAFLDDDDVVYQHGYKTLIEQLATSEAIMAVGGCRTARVKKDFGNCYIEVKETPFTWGRNRLDLLKDNFIPIHAYVIDRNRVDDSDLYFDDKFPPLEDYEFLLRLNSKYEFDFSKLDTVVCEYRLHGSNSLPVYGQDASSDLVGNYQRAFQLIDERKKTLSFSLPVSDVLNLLAVKTDYPVAVISEELSPPINQSSESENPQIIRKAFDSTRDRVYNYFSRHPRVERQLSKTVHFGWRIFAKLKSNNSDNK